LKEKEAMLCNLVSLSRS